MEDDHPVTGSLHEVLQLLYPGAVARSISGLNANSTKHCLLVTYSRTFDDLWKLDGDFLDWLRSGRRKVIVVWDSTPEEAGTVAQMIRDHVTALDWAVALSLAIEGTGKEGARVGRGDQEPWRLFVIDLASPGQPGAHAVQTASLLLRGSGPPLPSVRVVGPSALPRLVSSLLEDSVPDVVNTQAAMLRALWSSPLTTPADPARRHSVANVIAPQVLLAGIGRQPSQAPSRLTQALQRLMEVLGLLGPAGPVVGAPWVGPEKWNAWVGSFVLVDDMHNLGWSDFLKAVLGLHQDDILQVYGGPDRPSSGGEPSLVDLLVGAEDKLRVGQGISFRSGRGARSTLSEILFLDLRLFGARPGRDEIEFFKRLLELAKQVEEGKSEHPLPWPGFTKDELTAVERWLEQATPRETAEYRVGLTLLPRLVALVDPRLPVIVFSSTGRKEIVDSLSKYDNIVLEFDKPRFFGDAEDVLMSAKRRFEAAMERALKLGRARRVCRELSVAADCSVSQARPDSRYVEVYIDEAGEKRDKSRRIKKVGGLVAWYPKEQIATRLGRLMRENGLVWGRDRDDAGEQGPANPLPKASSFGFDGDVARQKLEQIEGLAKSLGVQIGTFLVEWSGQPADSVAAAIDPDYPYRALLKRALECMLFDCPWVRVSGVDVSIYVATRIDQGSRQELKKKYLRWGIAPREVVDRKTGKAVIHKETGQPLHRSYLFSVEDLFPVLGELYAQRLAARGLAGITRGHGVTFQYYGGSALHAYDEWESPRQLHYAADWVASKPEIVPDEWWDAGFRELVDDRFDDLAKASRAVDQGSGGIADAVAAWWRACGDPTRSNAGWRAWVTTRVAAGARGMSGEQFRRLTEEVSGGLP